MLVFICFLIWIVSVFINIFLVYICWRVDEPKQTTLGEFHNYLTEGDFTTTFIFLCLIPIFSTIAFIILFASVFIQKKLKYYVNKFKDFKITK